jgi:uncharacterized membrane protein
MRRYRTRDRWHALKQRQLDRCKNPALAQVVDRNIRTIATYRDEVERSKGFQDHLADWMTHWSGTMLFVYFHAAWFGMWVIANLGVFGLPQFDPFPYGLLTMVVSLEAIFLSTFVLISQNRQAELADRRSELDLQINLLTEYELTRVLKIVDALAEKWDVDCGDAEELQELEQDIKPQEVLKELENESNQANGHSNRPKNRRGNRL